MNNKNDLLITFETTKMLQLLNFQFGSVRSGAYYYYNGTPFFFTPEEVSYLEKRDKALLWRTCLVMELHQWLTEKHNISVEPLLKSKNNVSGTNYEVNIINIKKVTNVNSFVVSGTYYQAMIKGVESVCYTLTK